MKPIQEQFKPIQQLLTTVHRRVKKIKVYALIGQTGTGKSFRARLVAEKHHIDLIFDDGLLIRNQVILAGKSAKRERNRIKAIKRAILDDPEHVLEIRNALAKEDFNSILVLGISEKMIGRVVERLDLPYPDQIIYIEDVASEEEIDLAKESRKEGKHVIPVPVLEVKKDSAHRVLDSIKLMLKKHPVWIWKDEMVEKTIVQPQFSEKGRLAISETVIKQLVVHCIQEFARSIKIRKISVDVDSKDYRVEVRLILPYGVHIPDTLRELQDYTLSNINRAGIPLGHLHLTVDRIR
jgi:uncharacterized alkaline shock family protein YloU